MPLKKLRHFYQTPGEVLWRSDDTYFNSRGDALVVAAITNEFLSLPNHVGH